MVFVYILVVIYVIKVNCVRTIFKFMDIFFKHIGGILNFFFKIVEN